VDVNVTASPAQVIANAERDLLALLPAADTAHRRSGGETLVWRNDDAMVTS
jgi:hypothetical protein